ncbi:MAG: ferritin-like domain-containing protein [Mucilaginibacter sp.]
MQTSQNWIAHFKANALQQRVNWDVQPQITPEEIQTILPSLQAWQLGETSEGRNLIIASTKYARAIGDKDYVDAVKLFIKEEQKHGGNLGRYLQLIDQPLIEKNWGDSMFRKVRYMNSSMEAWTLAVIVVESTAQIFYQALKDATKCTLLKQICTDILIDEAYHITFQTERLAVMFDRKTTVEKVLGRWFYKLFFYFTSTLVWVAHRRLFKAGGNTFKSYTRKMRYKYLRTLYIITSSPVLQMA